MTYRDELEAAIARAQQSERALADERARTAQMDAHIRGLQEQLGQAHVQLAVYGASPASRAPTAPTGPSERVSLAQRILWILVAISAGVVLLAASHRERDGVAMARLFFPLWGAAVGGQLAKRQPTGGYIAGLALGAVGGFLAMVLFFGLIWPAL
jgi:hypothetical protein